MAFEYASFVMRNPAYVTKTWRRQTHVRRAMLNYRAAHPRCEFTGKTKRLHVHHKIPVSIAPFSAGDPNNLIVLERGVHLALGHGGNWKNYVANIEEVIAKARLVKTDSYAAYPPDRSDE